MTGAPPPSSPPSPSPQPSSSGSDQRVLTLGKAQILDQCDIEWIGSKDENRQGFHTGADALKHTLSVIRANPNLANRNVLLLHDNDSNAPDQDYKGVSVRKLPINLNNKKIRAGIENLLSEACITDEFYQVKEKIKANGDSTTSRILRKSDLCSHICLNGKKENFEAFAPALEIIEDYLGHV